MAAESACFLDRPTNGPASRSCGQLARCLLLRTFALEGDSHVLAATRPQPLRGKRLPSLDGLRAISALMVVVGHAGKVLQVGRHLPFGSGVVDVWGPVGVTVFFVLSGFLITRLIVRERRVAAEEDRLEDERANDLGMPERDLQRDVAAVAVAEEVCLCDVEVPEQRDRVFGGLLEGEGAVHVRGVAVSLLLERDHLSRLGGERDELAERGLDGGSAAVEQDERNAVLRRIAVDLVVDLEPVHGRVTALNSPGCGGGRGTHPAERHAPEGAPGLTPPPATA